MGPHPSSVSHAPAPLVFDSKQLRFLATKIMPPRCPGLIERPRLLDVASQLPTKRLSVIRAPAGFGKTSLAASWSEWLRGRGNLVAWFAIDSADDDPPRFLFYMAQALHRATSSVGADALQLIGESLLLDPQAIVSPLINDISDVDEEIYLFLEDYHLVTKPEIHEAVAFFLKHTPSNAHVVLTTRTDPPLPLASLRANNQLLEIDASALRFDLHETRAFLEHQKPGSSEQADVTLLQSRTEGWPAALRIVVSTSASTRDFGQSLRNFSGLHRSIDAYLGEMLDGLPADLVSFLLRTSILSSLSVPLCDAVTGTSSSRALLELIETRQLLLTGLDQEGQWYRYHPLLAEHLKRRLELQLADEVPELNRRAARWYASQELWTNAVQHALASGDIDQAVAWIEGCAMDLVKRGDLLTLLGWQRLFPPEVMKRQLAIRLAIAWGLALAIRSREALQLLDDIERDLGDRTSVDRERVTNESGLIRAVALTLRDEGREALSTAEQCLRKANEANDPWAANVAANIVRFWQLKAGDLDGFYATTWMPYSSDGDSRHLFEAIYRRCTQGIAEAQQLRLGTAVRHYSEALRFAEEQVGRNSIAAALPASLLAHIRYEQGQVEEAEALVIDRLPFIHAGANIECVLRAYFVMVSLAAFRRNFEHGHALLDRADDLAVARDWPRLRAAVGLERTRLYLHENRIREGVTASEQLERLAKKYDASVEFTWSEIHRYSALARAYAASAQGRFGDAIQIMERVKAEAVRVHDDYFALRVATPLSIARFSSGQTGEALRELRDVLEISAKAGLHQTILDEGAKLGPLLAAFQDNVDRIKSSPELKPYLVRLIAAWTNRYKSPTDAGHGSMLEDPLSARERAILNLIADGLSNKEIARNLAIAPETVKSHVKHIFIKLNAEKRAQAVARAQSLGLVATR